MYIYAPLLTWFELSDALANALHSSSTFMSEDDREKSLRVTATQGVSIGVTNSGSKNLGSLTAHYEPFIFQILTNLNDRTNDYITVGKKLVRRTL